ncbi:bile acid:sodium symporter family protein [Rhodopila sp.]|uniref:bile acid:sodium symporter family protein n=1 Tax=Rhodopila sp. TaxID=2480087 RepID=UPI003D108FC4
MLKASQLSRTISQWRPDSFVLALAATLTLATLLPCRGISATIFGTLAMFAIGSLFFLQGARLSRDAIIAGMTNWRLHFAIAATTFVLFPMLGTALTALFPHALTRTLVLGVLFLCALPSTVQSSIALTSIGQGNVAGAVCAATASSLIGLLLTPLLFGLMSHLYGGAIDASGMWKILGELLLPFIVGHLLRPWIGAWAARNRSVLAITDRGSILLVVYTAFSAAVVHGIWHQLPPTTFVALGLIVAVLLATVLLITHIGARLCGLGHADQVALVFCGSQKSLVAGIPIAGVLFSGPTLGVVVLPIMLYHPMQLVVCAWLARRFAKRAPTADADVGAALPVIDAAVQS